MSCKTENKIPAITSCLASKISPVENPPLFIVVGSDDNTDPVAISWIQSVMDGGTNADGSKRYMSFYVNTGQKVAMWSEKPDLSAAASAAYKAGHEVSNHTEDHLYCLTYDRKTKEDVNTITKTIENAQNALVAAGIPAKHHFGFRTPYLTYSDNTFVAMKNVMLKNGAEFLYDCSINAMDDKDGNNFPYTLDGPADKNGNVAPDNNEDFNEWGKDNPVREHKGIWELPAHKVYIDPQDYAFVEEVFKRKELDYDWKHITGLDYNLWNEAELNAEQTTRAYMNTLRKCLSGNRAPLTLGVHSQFYYEERGDLYPNITDPAEKRRSFIDFVGQASKIDGVFFVSGDMVIRWMLNPVSADKFKPENYRRT